MVAPAYDTLSTAVFRANSGLHGGKNVCALNIGHENLCSGVVLSFFYLHVRVIA